MNRATFPPRRTISWIYRRLISEYGSQGWWPVSDARRPTSGPVYSPRWTRGRLTPRQQFEVAVGAILTQNTSWTNVEKAMEKLIAARCLSADRLAVLPRRQLQKLIRSSGYFRQKSARLSDFSRYLVRRWGGRIDRLLNQPTSQAREELLSLNGIGPETADSILLYAGGHPIFVVDAYTRRIGRRFGLLPNDDYHDVQNTFMNALPASAPLHREYHALLVELAKRHCRAEARCEGCPVRSRCRRRMVRAGR
jgi:endonuclease III related protein